MQLSTTEIYLVSITLILGFILGIVSLILLLVMGNWCKLDKKWRKIMWGLVHLEWSKLCKKLFKNCKCYPCWERTQYDVGDVRSQYGFSKAMAEKYVEVLVETIDYAEGDDLLKDLLGKKVAIERVMETEDSQHQDANNGGVDLQQALMLEAGN